MQTTQNTGHELPVLSNNRQANRLLHMDEPNKNDYFINLVADVFHDIPMDIFINGVAAHKFLLCSNSEYFKSMLSGKFAENNKKEITIDWIPKELVECVVAYMYFHRFGIPTTAIAALYKVADYFMMPGLRAECIHVLEGAISQKNYFQVLATFHVLGDNISVLCTKKITTMYASAIRAQGGTEGFLKLPYEVVHALLSSKYLGTTEERNVVDPLIKWLANGSNNAKAERLLKLVRWNQLSDLYLCFLATQQSGNGKKGETLLRFVHEGMRYKMKRNGSLPEIHVVWPTEARTFASTTTYMFDSVADSMSDHDGY